MPVDQRKSETHIWKHVHIMEVQRHLISIYFNFMISSTTPWYLKHCIVLNDFDPFLKNTQHKWFPISTTLFRRNHHFHFAAIKLWKRNNNLVVLTPFLLNSHIHYFMGKSLNISLCILMGCSIGISWNFQRNEVPKTFTRGLIYG